MRILKLLPYLDATYPTQNWAQYLSSTNSMDWSKIAVGGHSQGYGHAAFFARKENVDRVLMFSGPNDYSDTLKAPAPWLSASSATPIPAYFSYLHLYDNVVDYNKQLSNIGALAMYPLYDSTLVEGVQPPYNNSRCLYMKNVSGLISTHSKTIAQTTTNDSVWTYMLSAAAPTSVPMKTRSKSLSLFPNPSSGIFRLMYNSSVYYKRYEVYNIVGDLILAGQIEATPYSHIDLSSHVTGIYILRLDEEVYKINKL